jgi:hypothetical protein
MGKLFYTILTKPPYFEKSHGNYVFFGGVLKEDILGKGTIYLFLFRKKDLYFVNKKK